MMRHARRNVYSSPHAEETVAEVVMEVTCFPDPSFSRSLSFPFNSVIEHLIFPQAEEGMVGPEPVAEMPHATLLGPMEGQVEMVSSFIESLPCC